MATSILPRTTEANCMSCRYFNFDDIDHDDGADVSQCRRRAPIMLRPVDGLPTGANFGYPLTHGQGWCGEHKPR